MIKAGDEKFDPPLSQKSIFGQKGGQKPKISPKFNQNSTKSDWAQIFRVVQDQQMIKVGDEKLDPP